MWSEKLVRPTRVGCLQKGEETNETRRELKMQKTLGKALKRNFLSCKCKQGVYTRKLVRIQIISQSFDVIFTKKRMIYSESGKRKFY